MKRIKKQTHIKVINYFGKTRTEKLELFDCGTHFSILAFRPDSTLPFKVNTGTAKYINKIWKEKTGKNGCLP